MKSQGILFARFIQLFTFGCGNVFICNVIQMHANFNLIVRNERCDSHLGGRGLLYPHWCRRVPPKISNLDPVSKDRENV
jgi:hypothetical protein